MVSFKTVHEFANDLYDAIEELVQLSTKTGNELYPTTITASIAATGTQSGAAELDGKCPIRLLIPSGWRSTAAAVRVLLSDDGTTYRRLYDRYGTVYSVTVAADQAVQLDPADMASVSYIKLSSCTAQGTAVTQGTVAPVGIVARLV